MLHPGADRVSLLLAALSAVAPSLAATAQTARLHVSVAGDDAAPGTSDRPLRTLSRARAVLRERRAAAPGVDHEVVLATGTWRITEPLRFGPADGGDATRSVTWRAAPGAVVTISGGRVLSGFTVRENGAWTVALPEVARGAFSFRELFVGGSRRPRARSPNEGFFRVERAAADRRSGFSFAPGDVRAVDDLAQVELVFLHDWSISRVGIGRVDETDAALVTTDPIGGSAAQYAIDNFEPHPRYCLENSRAYLDHAGEWFVDATTGELGYLPLPGESPDAVEVVAPVAGSLLEVRGDDERPVRNLHFVGLRFEHCAWQIPERGYAEGQANFHEPRAEPRAGDATGILREVVPAALHFERADSCSFRGGRIAHLGGGGIWFGSRCRGCVLRDTTVTDLSSNGVLIGEDRSRRIGEQDWWRATPEQTATGNEVRDCVIEQCGRQFFGAVGIWVGFARGTRITGNEIRDLPYTGVSLGWIWNPSPTPVGDNLVEDNHIHHVMQTLSDGGGIYTLGRQPGTVLRGNKIHDIPINLGRAESNGMFLDEGTTDVTIEDNVIWSIDRSPLRFHRATTNLVRNNLLVVRGDVPPVRYNRTRPEDIRLVDNVIARELRD